MSVVDSHFYHKQLSQTFSVPAISNNPELQSLIATMEPFRFKPSKVSQKKSVQALSHFDVSSFEHWRVPSDPNKTVFESLKQLRKSFEQPSAYHKLMLDVRTSYTARSSLKVDNTNENNTETNTESFPRHPSALSNASTVR